MESSVFICCDLVEWYLGLEDVRVTALHVSLYICVKTNNNPTSALVCTLVLIKGYALED